MHTFRKSPFPAGRQGCLRRCGGKSRPALRLVCFPWAGAGASVFRRMAPHLPPTVEVLAIQYPGREDRFVEDHLRRMEALVDHVLDDLIPLCDRPLVLFGHSMGAWVAYEVARALKAQLDREPTALIVSGCGSPASGGWDQRSASDASDEEFVAEMRRIGGTPREILADSGMLRAWLPVLRADYEVLDTYASRPTAPLSCALVGCAGDRDPCVSPQAMEAWRGCTTGSFQVRWFAGDHFYLCRETHALALVLREWAGAAQTAFGGFPSGRVDHRLFD